MTRLSFDTRSIRAISLDLDDTLWPVVPTIVRAEEQLRRWLALHAPATATLAGQGSASKAAREAVLARYPDKLHDFSHLRRESIRHLLTLAGDDPALAEPAFDEFFAWRQKVDLYPDALPALQLLAAKYPIVALTNGNADVARVGLSPYFAGAISARQFGMAKPAPAIYAAVAEHVGVPMEAVLHVGDDPELDVAGALAAGQQAAWVNREARDWPMQLATPTLQVRDMTELARLLLA
ncbi:HAD family hydrolase [Comamonas serinivorans]|uniref:HAD family hydrolase n=1 Tax=Comamonas serinivorans TaxID=1082851 RepID=A0A1Y0ELE9_9BURK|nr:HAD-IA family hydrolase [Comamonas serinivorans]ARU04427.1 HAD family hydrolase [Comamonas serinivorans]